MNETARKTVPGGGLRGFHHVALRSRDFDASVRFYREGLGMKELLSWGEGDGRAVMLEAGASNRLEIFAGGGGGRAPEGSLLHMAFSVSDCDAALERARQAGAEVTAEPRTVTIAGRPSAADVRIAFCKGPDGEVIEFFQSEDI